MPTITTYDLQRPGPAGDLGAYIDAMDLAGFARRVAPAEPLAHPMLPVSRRAAHVLLLELETELHEDAARGPTCSVAYGRVRGALLFAHKLGLIEVEELASREQQADELYLRRGR